MMDVGEAPLPSVHLKFRLSPVPSPKCIYLRAKLLPFKALLAGYRGSGTLCSQCPGTQIGMHKIELQRCSYRTTFYLQSSNV